MGELVIVVVVGGDWGCGCRVVVVMVRKTVELMEVVMIEVMK